MKRQRRIKDTERVVKKRVKRARMWNMEVDEDGKYGVPRGAFRKSPPLASPSITGARHAPKKDRKARRNRFYDWCRPKKRQRFVEGKLVEDLVVDCEEVELEMLTPEEQRVLDDNKRRDERLAYKWAREESELEEYFESPEYKEKIRRIEAFERAQRKIREEKRKKGEKLDPEDYWGLYDFIEG